MKRLFALAAALIFLFPLLLIALPEQDKEVKKQAEQERKEQERRAKIEADRAKQVEKFKKQFHTTYDKFKDLTRFRTGYMPLVNTNDREGLGDSTHFGVAIDCVGDSMPCESPRPYFYFAARSRDWRFLKNHSLIALAEGERITFDNVQHGGEVERGSVYSGVGVVEYITADMTPKQLSKMAKAYTVELQLGSYEFKLTPAELLILGEVVKKLEP